MTSYQVPQTLLQSSRNAQRLSRLLMNHSYHQMIIDLTELPVATCAISWQVKQNVLDRLWEASKTASPTYLASFFSSSTTVNYANSDAFVCACQTCGYKLHPGWEGTRLRTKQLSFKKNLPTSCNQRRRSARRREQRKHKRKFRAEKINAFQGNARRRSSTSPAQFNKIGNNTDVNRTIKHDSCCLLSSEEANCQRLVLLLDDHQPASRRKCLVLTCGKCHSKTYVKGAPKKKHEPTNVSNPLIDQKMAPSNKTFSAATSATNSIDNSIIAEKKYSIDARLSAILPARRYSLLEQRSAEKFGRKKIKIPSQKKWNGSNLMDFLSSLNNI